MKNNNLQCHISRCFPVNKDKKNKSLLKDHV